MNELLCDSMSCEVKDYEQGCRRKRTCELKIHQLQTI